MLAPQLASLGSSAIVEAVRNGGYSHYNALQVQFQRRMLHGLQALVSYTYAKSSEQGSVIQAVYRDERERQCASAIVAIDFEQTKFLCGCHLLRAANTHLG